MTDELQKLKTENERLRLLANEDELTGIMNRRALEETAENCLEEGCALIVCDLDYFKRINDRYGHLMGDTCLKTTAELLSYMTRRNDCLARIGGDEFVILKRNIADRGELDAFCASVEKRFQDYHRKTSMPLLVTAGGAMYQQGDTFSTLFERADSELMHKKAIKHDSSEREDVMDDWTTDINRIRASLIEEISMRGAYCRDIETFRCIYRFVERCMRRDNRKACVVLFTLTDEQGRNLPPEIKSEGMRVLDDVIRSSLRLGDVYTRYSSCQILTLLVDAEQEQASLVAERIRSNYIQKAGGDEVLLHYCYELKPAKTQREMFI